MGGAAALRTLLADPSGALEFEDIAGPPDPVIATTAGGADGAVVEGDAELGGAFPLSVAKAVFNEGALYAPIAELDDDPGMPPLELDSMTGPGSSGKVFAEAIAAKGLFTEALLLEEGEEGLEDSEGMLEAAVLTVATSGPAFTRGALLCVPDELAPAVPEAPFVVKGTQARFVLLLV